MRLVDLEPEWLTYGREIRTWTRRKEDGTDEEVTGPSVYHRKVDSIQAAQGVFFLCPKCYSTNHGPVGTHGVICWSRSRGVPDDAVPGPGRWLLEGNGFEDLTLNGDGGSRSVLLTAGCGWHGFVTNGEVTEA